MWSTDGENTIGNLLDVTGGDWYLSFLLYLCHTPVPASYAAFSAIVREPVDSEIIQKDSDTMQKTMQKDAKTIQKAIQKALEERGITITDLQMNILVFFYLNPTATRNDYISSDSNISEGGTKSSIARLQELELLKRKGGKKNGEWIVDIGTF